jgi:hypothetical protein
VSSALVQPAQKVLDRVDDTDSQRAPDRLSMPRRSADDLVTERSVARISSERCYAEKLRKHRECLDMVRRSPKVELEIGARVCALRVDEAELAPVRAQHPSGIKSDTSARDVAPQVVQGYIRCRGDQGDAPFSRHQRCGSNAGVVDGRCLRIKAQKLGERCGCDIPDRSAARRRSKLGCVCLPTFRARARGGL